MLLANLLIARVIASSRLLTITKIKKMIPIKKEPKELYKEFRTYENCKFCRKETDTWHEKTNTPICKDCAKSHKVADL